MFGNKEKSDSTTKLIKEAICLMIDSIKDDITISVDAEEILIRAKAVCLLMNDYAGLQKRG